MAQLITSQLFIFLYIHVGGTFRVYVAIVASRKLTENVVRNGVHRYKMLYFLGTLQEPTANTVKKDFVGL